MSTREETQITWSSATSKSVASGTGETSDALAFNAGDWAGALQINADNDGTAAAGDTLDVYILYTAGDVLGDSGDDYDTPEHAALVCQLNTLASDTPGEDPARRTIPLEAIAAKGFKLYARNNSAGRAITIRARLITLRGAIS